MRVSIFPAQLPLCFGGATSSELAIIQNMYFFEADRSPEQPTVSEEELFYEQVYIEK